MPKTKLMSAVLVDLAQARKRRERRLMLEAAAEHDLVLASLLAQKSPMVSDGLCESPEAVTTPRRGPQPPSD
jgi:hypothetical protein